MAESCSVRWRHRLPGLHRLHGGCTTFSPVPSGRPLSMKRAELARKNVSEKGAADRSDWSARVIKEQTQPRRAQNALLKNLTKYKRRAKLGWRASVSSVPSKHQHEGKVTRTSPKVNYKNPFEDVIPIVVPWIGLTGLHLRRSLRRRCRQRPILQATCLPQAFLPSSGLPQAFLSSSGLP